MFFVFDVGLVVCVPVGFLWCVGVVCDNGVFVLVFVICCVVVVVVDWLVVDGFDVVDIELVDVFEVFAFFDVVFVVDGGCGLCWILCGGWVTL